MPNNGIISYTGRDIQTIRNNLVAMIKLLDDNKWTDFNESDTGQAIIEIAAGIGDLMSFYLDHQALENYIDSVKQRRNGIALLNLINYVPYMTTSYVTNVTITISSAQDKDIYIPKYTTVYAILKNGTTDYRIDYATAEESVISAGDTSVTIKVIQGTVTVASSKVSNILNSQKIYLGSSNIAKGSVQVSINNELWTPVDGVLYIDKAEKNFSVYEDKDCKPYVLFNNSWQSLLPDDANTKVIFTYLVSLGKNGKVGSHTLTNIETSLVPSIKYSTGESIDMSLISSVTNDEESSGGSDRESLDHARALAPQTFRMLGKAIVLKDFYYMTLALPGVLNCRAVDWSVEDSAYVSEPYIVNIYIVPVGGGNCTSEFLNTITDYFMNDNDHRCLSSVRVSAISAIYSKVDIVATIYTTADQSEISALRSTITNAINDYFDPANLSFGTGIAISNIVALIQDSSPKVNHLELSSPTSNQILSTIQYPQLGNVELTFKSLVSSYSEEDDLS